MSWRLIPGHTLVAAPWRNGRGISRDIVAAPGWTVSIADLEQDGPFSHYPGMDRIFTPIAGDPPPELAFEDGPFEPCPLLVPKPFPGDVPTRSRIPAPGRAFNVIVARGVMQAAVTVHRLAAAQALTLPDVPGVVLHCLTGQVSAAGQAISPGDSLCGAGPADATAEAEAVVILVVVRPAG